MKIHAVFANRTYDPNIIELVAAWDEFCVESNEDGWQREVEEGLASWGDELLHHVYVDIDLPMSEVYARFEALSVSGEVTVRDD